VYDCDAEVTALSAVSETTEEDDDEDDCRSSSLLQLKVRRLL